MGRLKIALNDAQNLRDLLQEAYVLADEQIIQAQNEINKMASATDLTEEVMDGKEKYGKIVNNYLAIKDKAISKKLDIAKLLTEIYHHNGDVKGALEANAANMSFDFSEIKKMVRESAEKKNDDTREIELKR